MRQVTRPDIPIKEAYEACRASVNSEQYRQRLDDGEPEIVTATADYMLRASAACLHTFQPLESTDDSTVVLRELTKQDLVKLYDYHMVRRQPGRSLYERLSILSQKKCPFCGGIGQTFTLDHYLPKSEYPQFSVFPANLVPCCRDCNSEKGAAVATSAGSQVLHPYFDANRFYTDVWVVAVIQLGADPMAEYAVQAPNTWSDEDKERVKEHFNEYNLSQRYAVEAASELATIVDQWDDIYRPLTAGQRRQHFALLSRNGHANDWKQALYRALSQNPLVCRWGLCR
ncbi:MAG: hypothetical protein ABJ308_11440 [Halieaceae bacterium]